MAGMAGGPGKTSHAAATARQGGPLLVVMAGATALSLAIGVGRFAFTPLLPMMLRDGTIDLLHGSWLATANYFGYLLGALACMVLPRRWRGLVLIRLGMLATLLLTAGMALPLPALWLPLRFLAGAASAVVFVHAAAWSLSRMAELGSPAMGGAIFIGPGVGIVLSGLVATALVAAGSSAAQGWLAFALLGTVLGAAIWPVVGRDRWPPAAGDRPAAGPAPATQPAVAPAVPRAMAPRGTAELVVFALAYGLSGFGYIVTATFLPVIARQALEGATLAVSPWLDLFWPLLGCGAVVGALLATRWPARRDARPALALGYAVQALGVALPLLLPSPAGFAVASVLVGMPFTAITFFAMQEARRLRPQDVAGFMGLLTGVYGAGQIVGPPLVGLLLSWTGDPARGFALALGAASAALVAGAVLFLVLRQRWPMQR